MWFLWANTRSVCTIGMPIFLLPMPQTSSLSSLMLWNSKSISRTKLDSPLPKSSMTRLNFLSCSLCAVSRSFPLSADFPSSVISSQIFPCWRPYRSRQLLISSQTASTMQVCGDRFTLILVMPCSANLVNHRQHSRIIHRSISCTQPHSSASCTRLSGSRKPPFPSLARNSASSPVILCFSTL